MDLGGEWRLSDGNHEVAFAVPGDVVNALHAAGVIPDPYHGRNEYDCRWISQQDWVARRVFDHDGGPCDLVISGLDTVAEVRLNGHLVLAAQNAHRRYRVDVAGQVWPGQNCIEITFRSPVQAAARLQAGMPFPIPYQQVNGPIPNANMLRKPQCDFGWDWNVALGTSGIWGQVALEPQSARIGDVIVSQAHAEGAVTVSLQVQATGADVTASLCGITQTAPVLAGVASLNIQISNPDLWWPAGQGPQTLHNLTLQSGDANATRRIGLRDLRLVSQPDAAGRSFGFACNGRAIFAKGANWIPADALHGRITRDSVRDLLQSAVDAHMNMIRIWGGGRYEPDWFYDLCDEMGLMVWQDFMFACHLYPSTPAFLAEVDAEVRDVVARINHHACIALWCGDNELIGALTWFEESRKDRDRYLVNYDRLNRTVETALLETLPQANWWPSSPSPGPMAFGDAWHDDSSGDMHFWSVWHEGRDFDHYRDVKPRFCSEFGFQSYPSMNVIRQFADAKDWNIASPVMESHQKNPGGNARIAETMFRYFRFPVDFPSFVYLSQVQQGLAIKTAITQWRSLMPHCMGTLYWQLNDTWPVCSWASLDHGGGWKLLHHMARAFYAPITVVCIPEGGDLVLKAVNDTPTTQPVSLACRAAAMDGTARKLVEAEGIVPAGMVVELARLALADLGPQEILGFVHTSVLGSGCEIHAPRPWKTYDLQPSKASLEADLRDGIWHLHVSVASLSLFLTVEADVPGRFSTNARTVTPNMPLDLTFIPAKPGKKPRFVVHDLYSATYGA
ncbi:MAG: glycoside hydrolase family 2 protein [Rhodobacteraceae bacterium]|nr:glycoside hydrolase family 2 protein [Paracoccaceae bacterium]